MSEVLLANGVISAIGTILKHIAWLVTESMFNWGNEPLLCPKNGTCNVAVYT